MRDNTPSADTDADMRVEVRADHCRVKHLGHWTTARAFDLQTRYGAVVLDLRSSGIPSGDLDVRVEADHALVKLLVADDATVDAKALRWNGRGKVEDYYGYGAPGGRLIRLAGTARSSDIRIHRSGMAVLSAMCSKAYLADLRQAHRDGGMPSMDDPSRSPRPTGRDLSA